MRTHPKIRKTVKWGGAVVSVLLLVVWVGSGWRFLGSMGKSYLWASVYCGRVVVGNMDRSTWSRGVMGWYSEATPFSLKWSLEWYHSMNTWSLAVPLWIPFALVIALTATAWHLDTPARRRARIGLCPRCGYNRTGLAIGAVCPECGAAAIASSS